MNHLVRNFNQTDILKTISFDNYQIHKTQKRE